MSDPTPYHDPFALGGPPDPLGDGSTARTAPAVPGATSGGDDPLLTIIAEERRHSERGCDLRRQADELFFTLPVAEQVRLRETPEADHPAPMGQLYAAAREHEAAASALFDQVRQSKATTLAGVIAQLETMVGADFREACLIRNAVAALRDIAARGGAA